jgi:hypothetical protein
MTVRHKVIDSTFFCHVNGAVSAAIVNYQPFDPIEARNLSRQISQRGRKCLFLVEAGNLNH